MAFLGGLFGGSNAGQKSANQAQGLLLDWAVPASEKLFDQSRQALGLYASGGSGGFNALRDALGLAGEGYDPFTNKTYSDPAAQRAGLDRAVSRFRTTPGYEFARDMGEEALLRRAAQRGDLAGGQTSMDLVRFGQGLADSQYDRYLDRLTGVAGMGQAATTGISNSLLGQAGIYPAIAGKVGDWQMKGQLEDQEAKMAGGANAVQGILGGINLLGKLFPGGFR